MNGAACVMAGFALLLGWAGGHLYATGTPLEILLILHIGPAILLLIGALTIAKHVGWRHGVRDAQGPEAWENHHDSPLEKR